MKVSNTKCKFKISTMTICGRYMFEFSVDKGMKNTYIYIYSTGGDSRKSNGTFMSNTNCQGIGN